MSRRCFVPALSSAVEAAHRLWSSSARRCGLCSPPRRRTPPIFAHTAGWGTRGNTWLLKPNTRGGKDEPHSRAAAAALSGCAHHRRPPRCCLHSRPDLRTDDLQDHTGRRTSPHLACRGLHAEEQRSPLSPSVPPQPVQAATGPLTAFSLVASIRTVFHPIAHSPQRDAASIPTAKLAWTG